MKSLYAYINESENDSIQFTIWKDPKTKLNRLLKDDEEYQKIEYVFKDKEKNIIIDFLLGKKNETWQLWMGKDGSISYDVEPYYNTKEKTFKKGLMNAVDKTNEIIEMVKNNPQDWVQFYINR